MTDYKSSLYRSFSICIYLDPYCFLIYWKMSQSHVSSHRPRFVRYTSHYVGSRRFCTTSTCRSVLRRKKVNDSSVIAAWYSCYRTRYTALVVAVRVPVARSDPASNHHTSTEIHGIVSLFLACRLLYNVVVFYLVVYLRITIIIYRGRFLFSVTDRVGEKDILHQRYWVVRIAYVTFDSLLHVIASLIETPYHPFINAQEDVCRIAPS